MDPDQMTSSEVDLDLQCFHKMVNPGSTGQELSIKQPTMWFAECMNNEGAASVNFRSYLRCLYGPTIFKVNCRTQWCNIILDMLTLDLLICQPFVLALLNSIIV